MLAIQPCHSLHEKVCGTTKYLKDSKILKRMKVLLKSMLCSQPCRPSTPLPRGRPVMPRDDPLERTPEQPNGGPPADAQCR